MDKLNSINTIRPYDFRLIRLTNSKTAIVDPEDYRYLNQFHWTAKKSKACWYAVRKIHTPEKTIYIKMHREITRAPPGTHVHHKNHNSLDNRRKNLYVCSPTNHKLLH